MSFGYGWRGPNIVKDGLIYYADAGSPNSYYSLTGGTTWKDISGNSHSATLFNDVTFDSNNQGSFLFDGTDDYATTSTNPQLGSGAYAVSVWFKPTATQVNNAALVCVDAATATNNWQMSYVLTGEIYFFVSDTTFLATGITPVVGTWNNVTVVRENIGTNGVKSYHNGVFTAQRTNSTNLNYTEGIQIGLNRGDNSYFQGNIAQILLYSGYALSATEVLQNYNATKTRFGL
jgi:hypothetical protein